MIPQRIFPRLTRRVFIIACTIGGVVASAGVLPALGGAPAAQKIRVLIVDGQNNHDWEATTKSLRATLLSAGRFEVEVSTSPPPRAPKEAWTAWRPAFARYGVVVLNYNGQMWPEEVRKAFAGYVEGGGGVVVVHAANNAFAGWKEYNDMIGLGWRGADFGDRITIDDATGRLIRTPKGKGPGAGHGRQHAYVITVRAPDHPIQRGIPRKWMHAKDELYHGQRGPAKNMTVLSSAFSARETGGTGKHEPITWVIPYGQGNVVTTVMGHHWRGQKDFDALHCVGFQTIFARSCEWAATGKVTLPVPAAFPGPDKISVVPPEKLEWKPAP